MICINHFHDLYKSLKLFVRPHHYRLHINWVLSELSLGQVWEVDLQRNEATIKDVLLVAQGEMALEEFLKQVGNGRYL